ncbi:CBS domain-containing protein [Phytohabitans houttuyneae]|uniref:CBS domain-containing protein n=1 Tax=Phytohabitans houttuyneae TaxID=1076126 RepID=A0A6V8KBW5_9ACTN|nr:CBS domain-containing protein [Phytohabitans houttuyneae]GFJ80920.1 hypothetical protein Phou_051000 [Phytohabitans houttuyneae]
MRIWTVADVMTADVVAVTADASYRRIVGLLAERRISAVPVVDEDRRVIGVVSEADLLYKTAFAGQNTGRRVPSRHHLPRNDDKGQPARRLMTTPAVTTGPGTSLAAAARQMDHRHVRHLPVVDGDGVLIGIIARSDLLKVHLRSDDELRRDIVHDVLGRTMSLEPSTVAVNVHDGVVDLRGNLDRKTVADLVVNLTAAVAGVVRVDDRLTYDTDDTGTANPRDYWPYPAIPT